MFSAFTEYKKIKELAQIHTELFSVSPILQKVFRCILVIRWLHLNSSIANGNRVEEYKARNPYNSCI